MLLSFVAVPLCMGEGANYSRQCQPNPSLDIVGTSAGNGVFHCSLSNCSSSCNFSSSQCLCYDSEDQLTKVADQNDARYFWRLSLGIAFILLVYPVIFFFNINLASGPKQSLVFFYQCLPLVTPYGKFYAYFILQNQNYDNIIFITEPLFSRFYIFEYLKYAIAIIELLLVLALAKCTCCPLQKCRLPWAKVRRAVRNFRDKHVPKHSVLQPICSVALLAYGDLLATSSLIILNTFRTCCYDTNSNCPDLCVNSLPVRNFLGEYKVDVEATLNVWKAFSIIVYILLLPLPIFLIYYPSIPALFHKLTGISHPRFPKLDPVFDVFQGVYKEKMRWFAGVHLLYRMILWAVFIELSFDANLQNFVVLSCLVVILGIHSLFQPYKLPKHNYIETLYLVYLVIIAIFYHLALFFPRLYPDVVMTPKVFAVSAGILGAFPLLGISILNVWKLCRRIRPVSFTKLMERFHWYSRRKSANEDSVRDPSNHCAYHESEWVARTLSKKTNSVS